MIYMDRRSPLNSDRIDTGPDTPFRSYAFERHGNPRFHIRLVENVQAIYPDHKHDYFQIVYFMTEAPPIRVGLFSQTPQANSIYFISPMTPHQIRFDNSTACIVLYFDLDFIHPGITRSYPIIELIRFAPELTPFAWQGHISFNLNSDISEVIKRSLFSMLAQFGSKSIFAHAIIRSELGLMLGRICQEYERDLSTLATRLPMVGRDREHMRRISDFISENYIRRPSLEEAAQVVHLSKSRLCALVRQYTGSTLNALMREMRIDDARERLVLTNDSIAQIAYSVGYDDEKHFLRVFKACVGMTPGMYRQSEIDTNFARCAEVQSPASFRRESSAIDARRDATADKIGVTE